MGSLSLRFRYAVCIIEWARLYFSVLSNVVLLELGPSTSEELQMIKEGEVQWGDKLIKSIPEKHLKPLIKS